MSSDTTTLTDSDWNQGRIYFRTSPNSTEGRLALLDTLDVPAITQEIYDGGQVEMYFESVDSFGGSPDEWKPLPYERLSFDNEFYYNLNFSYEVGQIVLAYYYTPTGPNASTPDLSNADLPDYTFKYVVTAPATTQSMEDAGVNWDNHDEVMNYLNGRSK